MNILIPHNWLLEHLETTATPEEIQKYLSLSGPSVERIYDRKTGPVYDIEVTTNRVDSMSVQGIAREAAVILSQFGLPSKLKPYQPSATEPTEQLPLPKIVNDEGLGQRVLCVILKDVQRTPTPDWMADKLLDIEQNIHDSVIDITNYVTHDLGHPIHAFDYDAVMALGGEIRIVTAPAGKKFVTLDGTEYSTVGGEVVFENPAREIIDLPSIKGTANASVTDTTKNVLLWIESIPAQKVRFASMTHAIRTVAAQISEKNLDPHLADATFARAIELYQELCQATVASEIYDEFPAQESQTHMTTPLTKIDTYLGIELPVEEVVQILTNLGCTVTVNSESERQKQELTIQVPTFRPDLRMGADIVEEIARIYGYHKLPSTLMTGAIPTQKQTGVDLQLEQQLKNVLAHLGWQELYSYSFVSEKLALDSGYQLNEHIKLQNPLTDDKVYMRRSLIPSLTEALDANAHMGQMGLFEIANTYHPQPNTIPTDTSMLSLVSNWPYEKIRADIEYLLSTLYLKNISIEQKSIEEPHATITVNGVEVGDISIDQNQTVALSFSIQTLSEIQQSHPTYQPIPKTAALTEDLTFTLPESILIGEVLSTISAVDSVIKMVTLKDQYLQNFTFTITYHDANQTLSSERVEPVRKKIVATVKEKHDVALVGKLE